MRLEVLRGDDAHRALGDRGFQSSWTSLHQQCPWSTVFQNVGFATVWYRVYRDEFEPVVAVGYEADGSMSGLFLLARERKTGVLVHVGAHHAEYQTWIARPDRFSFISDALDALRPAAAGATLRLRYAPSVLPLEPLTSSANWGWRTVSWLEERGIADLTKPDGISSMVESSRYRYRMRKLGTLGPVSFRTVTTRAELEPWLDQIIAFCDVRQGAINAVFPFRDDPFKRELHLAWLDAPDVVHVTLLTAGNTLISSQINYLDRRTISLGLISHSPMQGKISPGTLHLLLLARHAAAEGFDAIDLTPGGEYKDRFASFTDPTRVVSIQFSATQAVRARVRRFAAEQAKIQIREMGLEPAAVKKQLVARVERIRRSIVRLPATQNGHGPVGDELSVFRFPREFQSSLKKSAATAPGATLRIDEVGDLLLPSPSGPTPHQRRAELRAALARFERGGQLFTRVEDDCVTNLAWLTKGPGKAHLGPGFEDYELSDAEMLVHNVIGGFDAAGEKFLADVVDLARARNPKHELSLAIPSSDPSAERLAAEGAERVRRIAPRATTSHVQHPASDPAVEQQPSS